MSRTGKRIARISLALPLLAALSFAQAPSGRPDIGLLRPQVARRGVAKAVPAALPAPVPAQAPAPLSLSQLPSAPPQVSYQSGMLTIVAENSTLGDILREVHKSTGAEIEVPPSATERVVARIGPGPARDVLASLLNGSAFNYVMVGSASDPSSLASVILTMKQGGGAGETVANVYQPPQQFVPQQPGPMAPGTGPGGPVVQAPADEEEADAEDKDEEDNADQEQAQDQAGSAAPADGSQPNVGPKTPEQILEMLRSRQGQTPGQVPPGQQFPRPNVTPPDNNE
jgi:hypothetical protein